MYLKSIRLKGKKLEFPTFFPDGTRAVVRSLDSKDLEEAKVEGIIVNTYHLARQPGDKLLAKLGGVKKFMNWKGFIISDSGGFQIMSLIHRGGKGKITKAGVYFEGERFTPENSIQIQFNLGVDVIIVLDYFTSPKASKDEALESVKITIEWAKRSKEEYLRQIEKRKIPEGKRPLLLAVIQGGFYKDLREKCAGELLKIGFDGYGFGGWPVDDKGNFDFELMRFNAALTPDDKIRFALGVGKPENIVEGVKAGYHIFDCVLPTRDARHRRLYVFKKNWKKILEEGRHDFYEYIYPTREEFARYKGPIEETCDCYTCQNYSLSYLRHLFKIEDTLAYRLASIHNLRFYTRLIEALRKSIG